MKWRSPASRKTFQTIYDACSSGVARCRQRVEHEWFRLRLAYMIACARLKMLLPVQQPFVIESVVLYHPDDERKCMSMSRHFDPTRWEEDALSVTGWTAVLMEVRYSSPSGKYRALYRKGDTCKLPLPYRPRPRHVTARTRQALLRTKSGAFRDITSRVIKYEGLTRSFHSDLGLKVHVHEMFPWWNRDELAGSTVHVWIDETLIELQFDFDHKEPMEFPVQLVGRSSR